MRVQVFGRNEPAARAPEKRLRVVLPDFSVFLVERNLFSGIFSQESVFSGKVEFPARVRQNPTIIFFCTRGGVSREGHIDGHALQPRVLRPLDRLCRTLTPLISIR